MAGDFNSRAFRDALGCFATGVCVITTATPDGQLVGITANSFASVSLDPPLVLWMPATASRRHDVFADAQRFAIHVLAAGQGEMAADFVREANAFGKLDWSKNAHGVPVIDGCVSRFECKMFATYPGGDHTIIVGEVENFESNPVAPLVFSQGRYANLA